MLSRRQMTVQKDNLISICRISVKCLLDYASLYTHVNDDSEEFINFCAVFEQLVSHRLQPNQKKTWLPGQVSPRHFWDVLLDNYHRTRGYLYQSCIPNIEAIETIKSPKAKLRAFIRVALMEKRLSDYLCWVRENKYLMRESYLDGAFMTSDEAAVLFGELIGLNAIDFNFCLKGNENELLGPLEINYSPFLTYKQSCASQCSDEIEMLRLSGKDVEELKDTSSILTETNINDVLRVQNLEKDMRQIKEQKDYLEELLRLRERQLTEANFRIENANIEWQQAEKSREQERLTMEACILELQKEMTKLQKSNDSLKAQVSGFRQRSEMKEAPKLEVVSNADREANRSEIHVQMDSIWSRSSRQQEFSEQRSAAASSGDPSGVNSFSNTKESQREDKHGTAALLGTQSDSHTEEALHSQYKQQLLSSQKERTVQASSTLNPGDDQITLEHHLQLGVKEQVAQTASLGHSSELDAEEEVPQTSLAHPLGLDLKDQVPQTSLAHPLGLDLKDQVPQTSLAHPLGLDLKDQVPQTSLAHPLGLDLKDQVPQTSLAHPLGLDLKDQVPQTSLAHPLGLDLKDQVPQTSLALPQTSLALPQTSLAHPLGLDLKDQVPKYDIQNSATSLDVSDCSVLAEHADSVNCVLSPEMSVDSGELATNHSNGSSSTSSTAEHSIPILSNENCSNAEFQAEFTPELTSNSSVLESSALAGREQNFPGAHDDNGISYEYKQEMLAEPVEAAQNNSDEYKQ